MDVEKIDEIIDGYVDEEGVLIQILLDIQHELNWIPKESIIEVSRRLQIPISQIYRVASFYTAMSLTPMGRHLVQVCLGTACHVRGAPKILNKVENTLKIKAGETTEDMMFTLRRVNCLGCCAMGPMIVVDKDYYGKMKTQDVGEILERYE
ncbi:MAG: NADH-quinone oxidoreductase subunit NuoE [Candidatus Methanolliviera hydrocarbonicum]|uniref:NADH-quinone oxidoreductase subunit NuoE n=1 Tax=Candidatus Methanolliviera hydrocarbonicum TaxID=2491085 RepID=A0A520KYG0_9EURY|nr:MAG: NADH-quinone oxidoreductase subunit NuoE [Candidatus Methanolliviera hydrocarbonicum]